MIEKIPHTPCYVVDEKLLRKNLEVLRDVRERTGASIILALKGFSMFSVFPVVREYLKGVSASSLNEARLGREEFKGEVHICSPAYREDEIDEIIDHSDSIVFNSISQWHRFRNKVLSSGTISPGLRLNPEHSEVKVPMYDPCYSGSRLGITLEKIEGADIEGIEGLHFHTLCELGPEPLRRTVEVFEKKFSSYMKNVKWMNFGGGHHITRPGYDLDILCSVISDISDRYGVEVYLEPGEAVALNTGYLVSSVLDIVENNIKTAILDTSAAAHMPDVLEMPYRPDVEGSGFPGENTYTYRLGGVTCLAGDIIGDYSFPEPLRIGDKIVFKDMAHYTMVKNNTFNGVGLPSICVLRQDGKLDIIKKFGYEDFKGRLS